MKTYVIAVLLVLVGCLRHVTAAKNVVIDISHYQGIVDMKKVKEDGIELVIHKCTQGLKPIDPYYVPNRINAKKYGLQWAAYHFTDSNDGKLQAQHFMRLAGQPPELDHLGSLQFYAVDLEGNGGNTVGKKQAEDIVSYIKQTTGRCPVIYGGQDFLDRLNSKLIAECPLWVSSYRNGSTPKMPKLWKSWYMWQYTNGTVGGYPRRVKGVYGPVDRSILA